MTRWGEDDGCLEDVLNKLLSDDTVASCGAVERCQRGVYEANYSVYFPAGFEVFTDYGPVKSKRNRYRARVEDGHWRIIESADGDGVAGEMFPSLAQALLAIAKSQGTNNIGNTWKMWKYLDGGRVHQIDRLRPEPRKRRKGGR